MNTHQTTLTDAQWRARVDHGIARHDWHEDMQQAAADAAHNLGLMVMAMVGGEEYERHLETEEYIDSQLDAEWHSRGGW